jgi:hypothetical protein
VKELTEPKKYCPVMINGLKRSLNINGKSHLVFGIETDNSARCNGVLIKVSHAELVRLKTREKLYTLKPLDKKRVGFPYQKRLQFNPADTIVYFSPQAEYVLTPTELLTKQSQTQKQTQNYTQIAQRGAAAISDTFLQDFLATTII